MLRILERALLFLSVFSLSEAYFALSIGPVHLSAARLFTSLLLGVVAVGYVVQPRSIPRSAKNLWAFAFVAGALPGLLTTVIIGAEPDKILAALLTPLSLGLFYFLLVLTVRDEHDVDFVLWAFAFGGTATAVSAFLGVGFVDAGSYYERTGGLGGNPNLFALNMVSALAVTFMLFVKSRGQYFRRIILVGMMFIAFLGFVGTVSRAGFLSVLALGGFVMVASRRLDLLRWAIPSALVIGLGLAYIAPPTYYERISTINEEAQDFSELSLDNKRIRGWYWALKAFAQYPLSGVGTRSYKTWAAAQPGAIDIGVPHNGYLYTLSTMGLAGFVPWISMMLLSLLDFSRVRRLARRASREGDPEIGGLEVRALYLQGALVAWMVANLVSPFQFEKAIFFTYALSTVLLHLARQRIADYAETPDYEKAFPSDSHAGLDPVTSPWVPR